MTRDIPGLISLALSWADIFLLIQPTTGVCSHLIRAQSGVISYQTTTQTLAHRTRITGYHLQTGVLEFTNRNVASAAAKPPI